MNKVQMLISTNRRQAPLSFGLLVECHVRLTRSRRKLCGKLFWKELFVQLPHVMSLTPSAFIVNCIHQIMGRIKVEKKSTDFINILCLYFCKSAWSLTEYCRSKHMVVCINFQENAQRCHHTGWIVQVFSLLELRSFAA